MSVAAIMSHETERDAVRHFLQFQQALLHAHGEMFHHAEIHGRNLVVVGDEDIAQMCTASALPAAANCNAGPRALARQCVRPYIR